MLQLHFQSFYTYTAFQIFILSRQTPADQQQQQQQQQIKPEIFS